MAYRTEKLTPFELLLWGRNNGNKYDIVKVTTEAGQTFRVHFLPPQKDNINIPEDTVVSCNQPVVTFETLRDLRKISE